MKTMVMYASYQKEDLPNVVKGNFINGSTGAKPTILCAGGPFPLPDIDDEDSDIEVGKRNTTVIKFKKPLDQIFVDSDEWEEGEGICWADEEFGITDIEGSIAYLDETLGKGKECSLAELVQFGLNTEDDAYFRQGCYVKDIKESEIIDSGRFNKFGR